MKLAKQAAKTGHPDRTNFGELVPRTDFGSQFSKSGPWVPLAKIGPHAKSKFLEFIDYLVD